MWCLSSETGCYCSNGSQSGREYTDILRKKWTSLKRSFWYWERPSLQELQAVASYWHLGLQSLQVQIPALTRVIEAAHSYQHSAFEALQYFDKPNQFRQKTHANIVILCLVFSFALPSTAACVSQTCKAWQILATERIWHFNVSCEPSLTQTACSNLDISEISLTPESLIMVASRLPNCYKSCFGFDSKCLLWNPRYTPWANRGWIRRGSNPVKCFFADEESARNLGF